MKAILALLVLAGVAAADDDLDVPGRNADLRGDAMVREAATFYLQPSERGTSVQFIEIDPGHTIPVRIISSQMRDMVEVELEQAETCAWRRVTPDERVKGMRLYVKRSDLVPVVTKPFAVKYPNGTSAKIAPGVPVTPTANGSYLVYAQRDRLLLPIPHASVGYTYKRGAVAGLQQRGEWHLDIRTHVLLGDADIEIVSRWHATVPSKRPEIIKLKWSTRCIDLVVAAPSKHLALDNPADVLTPLFKSPTPKQVDIIPQGTPLTTVGGEPAGVAAFGILVYPPANGLACFDSNLTEHVLDGPVAKKFIRPFQLCANANAAQPLQRRENRRASGQRIRRGHRILTSNQQCLGHVSGAQLNA